MYFLIVLFNNNNNINNIEVIVCLETDFFYIIMFNLSQTENIWVKVGFRQNVVENQWALIARLKRHVASYLGSCVIR